jgi:hypothetical protein
MFWGWSDIIFLKSLLPLSINIEKHRISSPVCKVALRLSACIHSAMCVAVSRGCISK